VLPPGPSTPSAVQTWEWLARPTTLLRRCAARYGEPFTLRTAWTDAPMVVVSDPAAVRAVFSAPVDVAIAGARCAGGR
jgi:cytochrome P450